MPKLKDSQIFRRIKKTINLLSLGEKVKDFSSDNLALMNTPALLGKRDALYEKAINGLKKDIHLLAPEERSLKYEEALLNMISGVNTGKQILFGDEFKDKDKHENNPLNHYMLLLADTVQAALTLCNHQIIFNIERKEISDFLGKTAVDQMQNEDLIFSESETKVFECARKLIDKSQTAIHNYQVLLKKSMSKEDEIRYKKAFIEFLREREPMAPNI
jgi:hypothetical protein